MITCPSCGQENPASARFCNACGSQLGVTAEPAREERKVVTVLFADLVGFTSRAERMDPEDVRALLHGYHERVRLELERFGGTVEKFIGDAVMAVFGAPQSHEDDPERAVRAALSIRDWAHEEDADLQVRIGVNTGEVLVTIGAQASQGEAMVAGDAVNTAARIQSAAPVNGILVGETTFRATRSAIEYREAEAVIAKGKADPIAAWEVLSPRARVGVERLGGAELVGREKELALLSGALERAKSERQPQLVTLVGAPGIGKSRLVFELFKMIEQGGELVYWRRGRSLPYGEGVAFWALAEMVKAQAGILEGDPAEIVEGKLRSAVEDLLRDATDVGWVQAQLRPLVGIADQTEQRDSSRDEAFAAWRRLFEAMAERRLLVLVFEDLHWADDALLDFVDELVEWASGVPLLVIGTARTELFARRPGWGGGKPNALTISLSSLSDEDTARLVHALLGRSALPAETQTALLERAGGNPLYAEEFVALVQERGLGAGQTQALPESVQGILSARLDALSPEEKALLQDAAVLGRVFWAGALARMADLDRREVERRLHTLERREFIGRERRASVAGETEYAFRHLLVRDAAYGQIPRKQRAERHRLAAEWIETLGRADDHAELLAHHYVAALEYARASGADLAPLTDRARSALRGAGDRALSLTAAAAAARFYGAALELTPPDDPDRPRMLLGHGEALHQSGQDAAATLYDAAQALLEAGDRDGAARAETLLAEMEWQGGHRDGAYEHLARAVGLIQDSPPSPTKAQVLSEISRYHMLGGRLDEAIAVGLEALSMAERFRLEGVQAHALNNIGTARADYGGEQSGLEDLRKSIEIATAAHSVSDVLRGHNNLGAVLMTLGDFQGAVAAWLPGLELADRYRGHPNGEWLRGNLVGMAYASGRWDELQRRREEFLTEQGPSHYNAGFVHEVWGRVRLARGDLVGALQDAEASLESARRAKDPQRMQPALATMAFTLLAAGRHKECSERVDELLSLDPLHIGVSHVFGPALDLAWIMTALSRADEFLRVAANIDRPTRWLEAGIAFAQGEVERSADVCARIGVQPCEAYARLLAGEKLLTDGRPDAAAAQLDKALSFYRSVGATAYIRRAEASVAARQMKEA
jgi:class 3 adenylate cyclase/tetratricopeptide (TPR) repeat protein